MAWVLWVDTSLDCFGLNTVYLFIVSINPTKKNLNLTPLHITISCMESPQSDQFITNEINASSVSLVVKQVPHFHKPKCQKCLV